MSDFDSQIAVRLPKRLYEQLAAESVAQERTVAQTIRLAIRQYLERCAAETSERPDRG